MDINGQLRLSLLTSNSRLDKAAIGLSYYYLLFLFAGYTEVSISGGQVIFCAKFFLGFIHHERNYDEVTKYRDLLLHGEYEE